MLFCAFKAKNIMLTKKILHFSNPFRILEKENFEIKFRLDLAKQKNFSNTYMSATYF